MKLRYVWGLLFMFQTHAYAVAPDAVVVGSQLFEQEWNSQNPSLGSDGLGPLFNANSCATCHRQGGVGGGGEAEFNAKSVGIESIEIQGQGLTGSRLAEIVSNFHPGFVLAEGNIVNVVALAHQGGTPLAREFHDAMVQAAGAEFAEAGGPTDASEVRIASQTPIVFERNLNGYLVRIQARMFGRNTTALFGSGLIDRVPDELLDQHVRLQKNHPEISGRPSTLRDGRYGKFGWRANVATLFEFTDQACANEMGLQTRRKPQAGDPTNKQYRNATFDITDGQVQSLTQFVATLPAPIRSMPHDPATRGRVQKGEVAFNRIGCAVCHVQNMGVARGIYSDLLLHDMGRESLDLNHAEPYVVRRSFVENEVDASFPKQAMPGPSVAYYGPATVLPLPDAFEQSVSNGSNLPLTGRSGSSPNSGAAFSFFAPKQPQVLVSFRLIDSEIKPAEEEKNQLGRPNRDEITRVDYYERMQIEPTNFTQEWRTPPLWGVRDSAPYMHDGRAETLLEAIAMHDGEAAGTRDRFLSLSYEDRQALITFLESLVAPGN
ncbi:MAG: di-heme oxidoredictase family protein [Rhodopirellula sp. JB044]|uniref:di-heme oxidoredictase family protein n=1 Tax=Rhodopirellula sp. JB044 TaxID=3342844 RepID=UPI00370BD77D